MDIHIHVNDRVAGFFRRMFRRRLPAIGLAAAVLASAGAIYAASPVANFQPGTQIRSSDVNDILNGLNDRVTALESAGGGGVAGYEIVTKSGTFSPALVDRHLQADCPAGKKAVGGGFAMGIGAPVKVGGSFPGSAGGDSSHWMVIFEEQTFGGGNYNVQAAAVCVQVSAPLSGQ